MINKTKLNKNVGDALVKLEYKGIANSEVVGAKGLYAKKVKDDLILTLGLETSQHFDGYFSGSFYLSKTLRWGSMWGDVPRISYQRVPFFLNRTDRSRLLSSEFSGDHQQDGWWHFSVDNIIKFVEAVKIAEPPFLEQDHLFGLVNTSHEIAEMKSLADQVIQLAIQANQTIDFNENWIKHAEQVLRNNNAIVNAKTIKLLAWDSSQRCLLERS